MALKGFFFFYVCAIIQNESHLNFKKMWHCTICGTSEWRSGFILGTARTAVTPTYSSLQDERPAVSGNIRAEEGHVSSLLSQNTNAFPSSHVTLVCIVPAVVLSRWLLRSVTVDLFDLYGANRLIVDVEERHSHPGGFNTPQDCHPPVSCKQEVYMVFIMQIFRFTVPSSQNNDFFFSKRENHVVSTNTNKIFIHSSVLNILLKMSCIINRKLSNDDDESELRHKYPDVALWWSTDEAVLGRIDSQCFERGVVGLEALALVPVGKLQDADPALPPACDKQLLPGGHREHGSSGLVAAEGWRHERDVGEGWNIDGYIRKNESTEALKTEIKQKDREESE